MALNSSAKAIARHRRERVARLRLHGLSQREIVERLARENVINTTTGEPFSLGTVNADLQVMEQEWRKQASADTATLKSQVLAEIREARRAAWAENEIAMVLKALAQEAQLLDLHGRGLNMPQPSINLSTAPEDRGGQLSQQFNRALERASDEDKAVLSAKLEAFLSDVAPLLADPGAPSNQDL